MENGGGEEERFPGGPWVLFPDTRDVEWARVIEDETIPLLEGQDTEMLKDDPLQGWPGPWNPEETNLFLNNAEVPLSDPLTAGEQLWDNFIDKDFMLNTPINLSPVAKLRKSKDVLETQILNPEPSQICGTFLFSPQYKFTYYILLISYTYILLFMQPIQGNVPDSLLLYPLDNLVRQARPR